MMAAFLIIHVIVRLYLLFWQPRGFQMAEEHTIYIRSGSDVTLKCPNDKVSGWHYSESKGQLAECKNGENEINPNLNISERLNITSDCQLQIQNFTNEDISTYLCSALFSNTATIDIIIRDIIINDIDKFGVIHGYEGEYLTLQCTVIGFTPEDTLYWTKDNELLASNSTSPLSYEFQPLPSNNKNEFICMANNTRYIRPLLARLQLNILLKPKVSITVSIDTSDMNTENIVIVRQGQKIELRCRDQLNVSGGVETFSWLYNRHDLKNPTPRLMFRKVKRERSGEYTCIGKNKAGDDSDTVNIIVTYPPIVSTKDFTFYGINRPRTLSCNVSGEPNKYNFTWRHYTNNRQLVRMFNTNSSGVLILPEGMANDLVYEDSGFYICNVTNGIPDEDENLWQSAEIKVKVEGKPVLAKPQELIFFGHFNGTSSMSLFVLSSSNVIQAERKDENGISFGHFQCSSTVNKTLFYGKLLDVPGYRCVYQIQNTREEDFQNYTLEVVNEKGKTTFIISLVSSRAPEIPVITNVCQRQNYIVLEWNPKFDGGSSQGFIVQYRKKADEIWKSIYIQSNETTDFLYISNTQPKTKYFLRMLAFNRIGNSSFTEQCTILTGDEKKNVWMQFKFLFLSIAVLLSVSLIVLVWRYRQALPAGIVTLIKVLLLEMTSIYLLTEMTYIPRLIAAG